MTGSAGGLLLEGGQSDWLAEPLRYDFDSA